MFAGAAAVPEGRGLAGPATVFGYGVFGVALGVVGGGVAAWKLSAGAVRPMFNASLALLLVAGIAIAVSAVRQQRARGARAADEAASTQAPFSLSVVEDYAESGSTFIRMEIDGARDTFVMTSRKKPGNPTCRGAFDAQQRARVLDALRRADDLLQRQPELCGSAEKANVTYRWTLPERGGGERQVRVTPACANELTGLYVGVESIAFTAENMPDRATCEEPTTAGGKGQ